MSGDYDIAVVGGGLAGLSAALTAARLGHGTILLTNGVPGGQLLSIEHIDGIPGHGDPVPGYDLLPISQEQCEAAGVTIRTDGCDAIEHAGEGWLLRSAGGDVTAKGVVIATGSSLAKLGVPGEADYEGRGVSDCASCDGPLLRGGTAVVVGGGDSAMQEALSLVDHAGKVILVDRGAALKGQVDYRVRIEASGKVEFFFGHEVTEILGDGSGVTGVRVKALASGAETELETAAVFAFVGLVPNSGFVAGLVPLDATGHIRVDAALRTALPGVSAAGNVREAAAYRAAGAMGDGAAAALALDTYLATGAWRTAD